MKKLAHVSSLSKLWPLAVALSLTGVIRLHAEDFDNVLLIEPAPAATAVDVAFPIAAPTPVEEVKPAKQNAKLKETSRLLRQTQPILYPTIFPNPLAFNIAWISLDKKTLADARTLAIRQRAAARRVAVVRQPVRVNAAGQNAIQQQMRKLLEPMLTSELSFAARAADLNRDERRKLVADGKAWFEKFLVDFVNNQDPNQQQMLLQGMQGVWFGNQQQKPENPRDALRVGVAKLVKDTLPKEKATAYANECRQRDEFIRQVSVENLVERIDEKVKLSPDQWKKLTKSLGDHWDKSRDPQLESFAIHSSMWPGAPDQWVLPVLSPAQRAVLTRVNTMSGRMFMGGGVFGQMFGGNEEVFNDIDDEATFEVAQPAAAAAPVEAEAE